MDKKVEEICTSCSDQKKISRRLVNRVAGTAFGVGLFSLFGVERIAKNELAALTHETGPNGGILRPLTREEIDDNVFNNPDAWEGQSPELLEAIKRRDYDVIQQHAQFEESPSGSVDAACQPGGCFTTYECRCSTSCIEPHDRTWTTRHCCAGCGCGWIVYAAVAGGCDCSNPYC